VYAFEEARRIGRLVIGGVLTAAIIVGARSTRSSLASPWLCTRNRPFTPPFPIRGLRNSRSTWSGAPYQPGTDASGGARRRIAMIIQYFL
jgi:hypothetical protein